jgi:hypothetical protein
VINLKVEYRQCENKANAYNLLTESITESYLEKLKIKATVEYDEENYSIHAHGKGFNLDLIFEDEHVEVELTLGVMFKVFKKKIQTQIKSELENHL